MKSTLYFYLLPLLLVFYVFNPIRAQIDTFSGVFTYELYTVVEGNKAQVSLLENKINRYKTIKIYVTSTDSVFVEVFDPDEIRKSITIITETNRVVYFDRGNRLIDLTNNSHEKEPTKPSYKKKGQIRDKIVNIPATWFKEISSVRKGSVLIADEFPYILPDLATQHGLYYSQQLGLIVKENMYYPINDQVGTRRFLELISFQFGSFDKPNLPDLEGLYKEVIDVD